MGEINNYQAMWVYYRAADTRNVRILCNSSAFTESGTEAAKHKLDKFYVLWAGNFDAQENQDQNTIVQFLSASPIGGI